MACAGSDGLCWLAGLITHATPLLRHHLAVHCPDMRCCLYVCVCSGRHRSRRAAHQGQQALAAAAALLVQEARA
jgi:hypothetical protein